MVKQIKFKTMQDVITSDKQDRCGYNLACQHNNICLQSEQKMHDVVT